MPSTASTASGADTAGGSAAGSDVAATRRAAAVDAPKATDRQFKLRPYVDKFEVTVGDGENARTYDLTRTEWTTVAAKDVEAVRDSAAYNKVTLRSRAVPDTE
jgi:hypothetical protein